ncbi:hypothetical protein [Celeribacter persicus]
MLYIYGKFIGETTLFVIDDTEEVTLSSSVGEILYVLSIDASRVQ